MGFFGRLFGGKAAAPARETGPEPGYDELRPTNLPPLEGPPEFVRAVEMQRAYWTHDDAEQARLESRGIEELGWGELLRLHHLNCLQRLNPEPQRAAAAEKCRQTARRLVAADSPYRPRPAVVWKGAPREPGDRRAPDLEGEFFNQSLTHLGCLEVYRLDARQQPTGLDFVGFHELAGVMFAPAKLIRAARLFYEGGRDEIVFVPLLYGLTWAIGNEFDRDGRMTRFVAHLGPDEPGGWGASGMGVGQQDLSIRSQGGAALFGLASVGEVNFPLDMRDPRFDEKARGRGIDPEEARRRAAAG
jgi:hypothetical protein